jgi:pimeloyl-ACP methyl ester carboxylesterase
VLGNPFNVRRARALTRAQFHYAFTNTLTRAHSDAVFDRYAVPAPGRVLFQGAFANFTPRAATRVNFLNDARAPLLFIAGGMDHLIPPAINRENARRWARSGAVTEYREFPDRTHYTLGQVGWEEVADLALEWAARHGAMRNAERVAPEGDRAPLASSGFAPRPPEQQGSGARR